MTGLSLTNLKVHFCIAPRFLRTRQTTWKQCWTCTGYAEIEKLQIQLFQNENSWLRMPHVDGMGTIAFLEEVRGVFRREEGTEELLASPCVLGTRWKMQGQLEHSLHAILAS